MLYFILWVVLILAVIIAIPVMNWLENKRRRELYGSPESDQASEPDEAMADEGEPEGFGDEVEPAEEEPIEVAGGEDFSAFDEEFK